VVSYLQTLFTLLSHNRIEQYHVTSHTANAKHLLYTTGLAHSRYQCISTRRATDALSHTRYADCTSSLCLCVIAVSPTLERLYIESGCPLEFLQSSTVNADVAIFKHFANDSNEHELLESLNIRYTARTRRPTRSVYRANVSCQSSLYAIHQLTLNDTRAKQ
jgi:hypothetical protein